MRRLRILLAIVLFSVFQINSIEACTNFLITKGASTDGSTMISYSADSHVLFGELYFRPAKDFPDGSMLDVYEWDTGKYLGKIKQASHTYSGIGNMNEHQVSIGETTYGGRAELANQPGAIVDYGSLMYITLQRAKTAREAIRIMGNLVAEYGYYSSGESFSISDANEVWIMEMIGKAGTIKLDKNSMKSLKKSNIPKSVLSGLKKILNKKYKTNDDFKKAITEVIGESNTHHFFNMILRSGKMSNKGAVWVAQRVPDGYVCAHANQARITTFPLNDSENCIYADDVISFARAKGWFSGEDKDFSFSDTYAPVDFGGARFCEIRVWSFFKSVNSDMQKYMEYASGHITHDKKSGYANNRMPLWIKPDNKVSVHDVMNFMRDHLEGTKLDMSADIGAGPYECPYRWRPLTWKVNNVTYVNERATATQQTGFSFVAQSRNWLPDPIGGIFWFGVDDAASSVYSPMYCGMNKVPEAFAVGNGGMLDFSKKSAFWIFNQVSNFAYTRYNVIHPEIEKKQQALETKYLAYTPAIDIAAKELYNKDKELGIQFITDYSVNTGNRTVKEWKNFYVYLFTKYMDGNIKKTENGEFLYNGTGVSQMPDQPGYGEKWYKRIVKETGDHFKYIGKASH